MSQLRDPNIVRVLGVCTQEEPLAVVVEYMKYGDLNQFLLQHVPEGSPLAVRPNQHTLRSATYLHSALLYLIVKLFGFALFRFKQLNRRLFLYCRSLLIYYLRHSCLG